MQRQHAALVYSEHLQLSRLQINESAAELHAPHVELLMRRLWIP